MAERHATLSREQLRKTLAVRSPENRERERGYALVDVSSRSRLPFEPIPGSIHIPPTQIDEFEVRFDREKTIVLYCADPDRGASRRVAEELAARGFQHVFDYEGGIVDWTQGEEAVEVRAVDELAPTGGARAPEPACARVWRSA